MPAAPEIRHRGSQVGRSEVLGQGDVEHAGASEGHVSIAGEVVIDLQGVQIGGDQQGKPGMTGEVAVGRVDIQRQAVGYHGLFEQSPGKGQEPDAKIIRVETEWNPQLRQKVPGPFDGALQQFREKTEVEGEDAGVTFRFLEFPIDVGQVGNCLEDEVGHPDSHQRGRLRYRQAALKAIAEPVQVGGKERQVLHADQHQEVYADRSPENGPPYPGFADSTDSYAAQV